MCRRCSGSLAHSLECCLKVYLCVQGALGRELCVGSKSRLLVVPPMEVEAKCWACMLAIRGRCGSPTSFLDSAGTPDTILPTCHAPHGTASRASGP